MIHTPSHWAEPCTEFAELVKYKPGSHEYFFVYRDHRGQAWKKGRMVFFVDEDGNAIKRTDGEHWFSAPDDGIEDLMGWFNSDAGKVNETLKWMRKARESELQSEFRKPVPNRVGGLYYIQKFEPSVRLTERSFLRYAARAAAVVNGAVDLYSACCLDFYDADRFFEGETVEFNQIHDEGDGQAYGINVTMSKPLWDGSGQQMVNDPVVPKTSAVDINRLRLYAA